MPSVIELERDTVRITTSCYRWCCVEIDIGCFSARDLCTRLASHGILTEDTRESVVRLAPPLIITETELNWACDRIRDAFLDLG